jgi:hypothetical protein
MDAPAGATPEESQAGISNPSPEDELGRAVDELPEEGVSEETTMSLEDLLGEDDEEEKKPFGDEDISEDEAVQMARK